MALGATWNPENARQVGQVVGQQLAVLGVNLLFGPALDVLDNPRPERGGSLGTRTFGSDPFWVGEMGQAYIRGIHQGSLRQTLTIANHFPGFGSSDRTINEGVPTINQSLDQLRQKDLRPFFKVTNLDSSDPDNITDGLMTVHARYQGLQGNLPISLDARNLATLLALKEISPWRDDGGLIVSAPLGAPAALEGIVGITQGMSKGLVEGIESICRILGVELSPERRADLQSLDTAGLERLLAQLETERRWP
jgi:beta-N-acetylhexosaminidase